MPLIFVIGAKELEDRTVTIRRLGGKKQETLALTDAVARLSVESEPPAG